MVKVVVIVVVAGCVFEVKGTIMQIEKALINDRLGVSKVLHSNYLQFCSGLPVKFAIFLIHILHISVHKQNFSAQ